MKNNRKNRKRLAMGFKADIQLYPFDDRRRRDLLKIVKSAAKHPYNRGFEDHYLLLVNPGLLKLMGWQVRNDLLQPIRSPRITRGNPFGSLAPMLEKAKQAFDDFGKALSKAIPEPGKFNNAKYNP